MRIFLGDNECLSQIHFYKYAVEIKQTGSTYLKRKSLLMGEFTRYFALVHGSQLRTYEFWRPKFKVMAIYLYAFSVYVHTLRALK
mgnify:FL=1